MTNTEDEFYYPSEYLKIDSTDLTVEETAEQIISYFDLCNLPE